MNPQKRNYNRKIRGRNQPVPQESENKSPAKRANKKSSQFDLNQTFISYSPQKKNYKNIKKHTDQLNNNINCYQENIPESPEVTPLVSQESPQSSYHNIPESFPSFRLPTAYPKVELTRSSTPSSDEQADSSFFRNHFEEEDIFMYAAWKKEVEAPYFVLNQNDKRRGPPERINDTLIGNISPKNFPRKLFYFKYSLL